MGIKIFKLVSGELVMATVESETDTTIELSDVLKVIPHFNKGQFGIEFEPLNPFAKSTGEHITFSKTVIMFTTQDDMIQQEYIKLVSGIELAKAPPVQGNSNEIVVPFKR